MNQLEDALTKKDEQIRDLSNILIILFLIKHFCLYSEYDLDSLQTKLKESKKVVVRPPEPPPTVITQSRLTQTDPWAPPPQKSDPTQKELPVVKQATVITLEPEYQPKAKDEILELKYQIIIEQKNAQIHQLMKEVGNP